jgi:hypothetical protein
MGCEMSISALACPTGRTLDWDAGSAAIDELSPGQIGELVDDFPLDEANPREALHDALERTRHAIMDGSRQSTPLYFGEWMIYLTGGLSWGDAPTDLYYEFWMLEAAGIATAIGFDWPAEANRPPVHPNE